VVTKNSIDRPEGNKLMQKLRMALSQNYICMSIDRFGKNASDILSTINLIISKQRYCREGITNDD
jgi:DNA invertase Pin-like site-specific DNA recombinase